MVQLSNSDIIKCMVFVPVTIRKFVLVEPQLGVWMRGGGAVVIIIDIVASFKEVDTIIIQMTLMCARYNNISDLCFLQ